MAQILLAEDDFAVRDFVYRVLNMDGHEVFVAHDGQEALHYMTSSGYEFELMLSDICMPVVDGVTLAKLVFRHSPRLPILLMTGYSDHNSEELVPSVVGVLEKPFTVNGVQDAVRAALGRIPIKPSR